jgi:hypothetical protein
MIETMSTHLIAAVAAAAAAAAVQVILPTSLQQKKVTAKTRKGMNTGTT